jgi:hypothetical protein
VIFSDFMAGDGDFVVMPGDELHNFDCLDKSFIFLGKNKQQNNLEVSSVAEQLKECKQIL